MTPQEILEQLKSILRIEDWNISLTIMDEEEYQKEHGKDFSYDTHGCTEIDEVNMSANIFLKATLTDREFKDTLLHECIHLVAHRYDNFVRKTVDMIDSRKVKKVLKNDALWEMEINVSKFTTIIAGILNKRGD